MACLERDGGDFCRVHVELLAYYQCKSFPEGESFAAVPATDALAAQQESAQSCQLAKQTRLFTWNPSWRPWIDASRGTLMLLCAHHLRSGPDPVAEKEVLFVLQLYTRNALHHLIEEGRGHLGADATESRLDILVDDGLALGASACQVGFHTVGPCTKRSARHAQSVLRR